MLYLWVVFGLLLLYKCVILGGERVNYLARGVALINALVLGKFVLIARALHLGVLGEGKLAQLFFYPRNLSKPPRQNHREE